MSYGVLACSFWSRRLPLRSADPRLKTSLWNAALKLAHHGLARLLEALIECSVEFQSSVVPWLSAPGQYLVKTVCLLLREPHEAATVSLVQDETHHTVELLWRPPTVLGIASQVGVPPNAAAHVWLLECRMRTAGA